ncbi:MAG: cobaltochelatase subunit CobN [Pseudomonadota bacterium]
METQQGMLKYSILFIMLAWVFPVVGSNTASAETLFGVISERNSAVAAEAAKLFRDRYPEANIALRTPLQIAAMDDSTVDGHLQSADAFLIAGVFGDDAARITRLIAELDSNTPLLAVSSASGLVALSKERFGDASSIWDTANAYWQGRGVENLVNLFSFTLADQNQRASLTPPVPLTPIRIGKRRGASEAPLVTIFDYETGDQAGNNDLHTALCRDLTDQGLACQSVFADWGEASADALEHLEESSPKALIMLQDFAVGGGDRERAEKALAALDIPVLKGIRLTEFDEATWRKSVDGLPTDSVYYRVAMPELSGAGQAQILAASAPPKLDPVSGIEVKVLNPIRSEIKSLSRRARRWTNLQITPNAEKRVAIVYYNHPPGRHNIGADNLDVPESLISILRKLKAEGYNVGDLPESAEALLALIQARAVNLPENNEALQALHGIGLGWPADGYAKWLSTLPKLTQGEMIEGPLAALRLRVEAALAEQAFDEARAIVSDTVHDMAFVIEGAPVEYHERAEALLDQLEAAYTALIDNGGSTEKNADTSADALDALTRALQNQGIEGLRGWGPPPGRVMTVEDQFVFPRLQFGNVVIGPQPPRGWEVNEEVLHANLSVPPTHQYLAFYHWLHTEFQPHAMVHLGRHSTYEFLPGKRVGLGESDYPRLIAGDVPGLYPYIVDGIGEGLQAKRRGLAVIIDHLTPPLQATPFYDELLGLRQLVESFEAADPSEAGDIARAQALKRIKAQVEALGIREALVAELEADHGGGETIEFEAIDPALLVHEVGHFLTEMQEDFMPLGLHVFGRDWSDAAIETMIESMQSEDARAALKASPEAEMNALLAGLEGRFIQPGKGNDPLRSPDALPTGRNFYALDASLVPNSVAWDIGSAMARQSPQADDPTAEESEAGEAVILWASDTVRDGGVMMSFGLELLGVRPVWNGRGIVTGLERLPLDKRRVRRDVTFVASGLFRDLYGEQMKWLDKAVLMALDGASETISKKYPQLADALAVTLAPLGELRSPASELLSRNAVAAAWVDEMLGQDNIDGTAGRLASLRLFAPAPGRYSAGVNRLAERSGAWQDRSDLARTYIARIGHAYGVGINGEAQQEQFRIRLADVDRSYLGRASNLYGLVDNNDAYDYLGGLNLAVEALSGDPSKGYVIDVSNPDQPDIAPLASAILQELRGRQLNPAWIKALMQHGYAGARTMNTNFFENLWGWEASDPELLSDTVWEEAKAIYIDDRYDIGVDDFFDDSQMQPVQANILAIMLVAAHKGFWQTDDATIEGLSKAFARVVAEAGLPGSGHTRPDHPMLDWVTEKLPTDLADQLTAVRDAARMPVADSTAPPEVVRELMLAKESTEEQGSTWQGWGLGIMLMILMGAGIVIGRRSPL